MYAILKISRILLVPALWFASLSSAGASSFSFNQLVVFGDSLSDSGNLYNRDFNLYPTTPNYTPGKFTDGPGTSPASTAVYTGLWHEDLSYLLGIPAATPSKSGGSNYAFAGAVTGNGTSDLGFVDNMGQQVNTYLATHGGAANSSSMYVLWGGANDLLNAAEATGATPADVANAETAAIRNLENEILFLASSGAKQFLWLDIPDLSLTPSAGSLSPALHAALAASSARFRTDFGVAETGLPSLFTGVSITAIDVYSVFDYITANASQFGLTNTTNAAQGTTANPDTYLFWDGLHPTTTGDALLALYVESVLSQPAASADSAQLAPSVPEPSTLWFAPIPLLCFFFRHRGLRREAPGENHAERPDTSV